MVFWSPRDICIRDWGVGYSGVIVTLCEVIVVGNPSGWRRGRRAGCSNLEKILCVCDWFTCFNSLLYIDCFIYLLYTHCNIYLFHIHIVDQYSYNKIALCTSNSYLEESRGRSSEPFTGYSASSLVLGDRCITTF